MARYDRPKDRRQKDQQSKGRRRLAAFVGLTVLIAGWYGYEVIGTIETDKQTLCPAGHANLFGKGGIEAIPEQHVILIDATDPYSEIQKRDVLKHIGEIKQSLAIHARLAIYAIRSEHRETTPTVSLCNPGDGRHLSPLTGNPKLAEKKWRERFANKIDEIVEEASQSRGDTSPILEYVQAIAVDGFQRKPEKKTLHIISDMRQNTPTFSHYRSGISYQYFAKSRFNEIYLADLHDVEVFIYDIQRPDKIAAQRSMLIEFWLKYFDEMGAKVKRVKPIAGAF